MQQLGKIRYREKRGHPCLYLICAFHPESSDKLFPLPRQKENVTEAGLLTYSTFSRPSRPPKVDSGYLGSKKAFSGANSIG